MLKVWKSRPVSFPGLESKRISHADEVVHRCPGQAGSDMEINLLVLAQLIGRAEMQQMSGPAAAGGTFPLGFHLCSTVITADQEPELSV